MRRIDKIEGEVCCRICLELLLCVIGPVCQLMKGSSLFKVVLTEKYLCKLHVSMLNLPSQLSWCG